MDSVPLAYGPILFGGALAFMLSGIVAVQCIIFFKLYPDEARTKKIMVATVWALDIGQTAFILASFFHYFIVHFGDSSILNNIPWSTASPYVTLVGDRPLLMICVHGKAMQTCVVHLFYAQKIYRSSGKNWWITGPIAVLACLRLLAATVATVEILRLGDWAAFMTPFTPHWFLFTLGPFLSAVTDIVITLCLCHYLRKIRRLSTSSVMKVVMDTLTLYTLENGLVTCLTTIGALTFWLTMPTSSIALSLNFIIGKLYPNSLLVLLNTRKELREMHSGDQGIHFDPVVDHLAMYYTHFPHRAPVNRPPPVMSAVSLSSSITPSLHDEPYLQTSVHDYRPTFQMHKVRALNKPVQVKERRTAQRDSGATSEASFDTQKPVPQRSLRAGSAMQWPGLP
ncbi:hypothetical protein FB451DRAFT_1411235 [Mycena latifolia]|nr:hypothetical protein FB451DRAFT_1411235 [Mycena latifolia]